MEGDLKVKILFPFFTRLYYNVTINALCIIILLYILYILKLKLNYDRRSVGQSVLVSGAHLRPATNFLSPLNFLYTVAGLLFCSALSDERTGL
jgi:hypothetical protein